MYIIDTPGYNLLTVYFQSFDVEKASGCYKDYLLTLIDGKFPSTYAVEKDCGKDLSRKTFREKAWFEFYSDGSVEKDGFKAAWRAETVTTTASTTTTSTTPSPESTYCLVAKIFTKRTLCRIAALKTFCKIPRKVQVVEFYLVKLLALGANFTKHFTRRRCFFENCVTVV